MTFQVSGKNLAIGESLAQRARNKVQAMVDRHAEGSYTGHMTIARDGGGFRADCSLNLGSGTHVNAEASSHDPYDCVDAAVERLGRQLARLSTRAKDHGGHLMTEPSETTTTKASRA
jgi:ribosomal subunit interface protein